MQPKAKPHLTGIGQPSQLRNSGGGPSRGWWGTTARAGAHPEKSPVCEIGEASRGGMEPDTVKVTVSPLQGRGGIYVYAGTEERGWYSQDVISRGRERESRHPLFVLTLSVFFFYFLVFILVSPFAPFFISLQRECKLCSLAKARLYRVKDTHTHTLAIGLIPKNPTLREKCCCLASIDFPLSHTHTRWYNLNALFFLFLWNFPNNICIHFLLLFLLCAMHTHTHLYPHCHIKGRPRILHTTDIIHIQGCPFSPHYYIAVLTCSKTCSTSNLRLVCVVCAYWKYFHPYKQLFAWDCLMVWCVFSLGKTCDALCPHILEEDFFFSFEWNGLFMYTYAHDSSSHAAIWIPFASPNWKLRECNFL